MPFSAKQLGEGTGVLKAIEGQVEAQFGPINEEDLSNALLQKINDGGSGTSTNTWVAYADSDSGLNASYVDSETRTHYALITGTTKPEDPVSTRWIALNPTGGVDNSGDPGVVA